MKPAIHLLLMFGLVIAPLGCSREQATDMSVSANTENADKQLQQPATTELRQPAPVNRPPARDTAPVRPTEPSLKTVEPADRVEPRDSEDREAVNRESDARTLAPTPAPAPAAPITAEAPRGTAFTVVMTDGVGTDRSSEGDTFEASLAEALTVDGKVLAERGTKVQGRVQNIEEPGKVQGRARLELVLTKIMLANRSYNLKTEPFIGVAADSKDRDAAVIAGGAGVGAIIGAIAGGKKGAALGAIIGGGSGTTAVLVTPGEDLKIEPETRVNFVLEDDLDLPVIRRITTDSSF